MNRRAHDPYAPHLRLVKPAPKPQPQSQPAPSVPAQLEDLTKAELIDRAERHGLPTYGNKQDLIDRLRMATRA